MSSMFRFQQVLRFGRAFSLPISRINKSSNYLLITRSRKSGTPQLYNLTKSFSTQAEPEISNQPSNEADTHTIIKDTEKAKGDPVKHEFQSETRMLLNIVAKSLYSDKEVFIRELISNASDALEKLRYLRSAENLAAGEGGDRSLEIHIATDKQNRTLVIQDTGVGMTKDELVSNLGTIARSGSKAFLENLQNQQGADTSKIIGQFGVGFYSAFMVADKVEVFTKSYKNDSEGLYWTSDGSGSYEIASAEGVQPGTKIVLHLRTDSREFSDDTTLNGIIKKYSNFVGSPIYVNGKRVNNIQALWMMDPKDVTKEQHSEFYRFISNSYDEPRFILHYSTDVPISIKALLYIPEGKPGMFEMARDTSVNVALYSRKILIQNKADNILPKFLRFMRGVVDSEDIPLNLSRELLQNSALITKLRNVLTARIIRFLLEQAKKKPDDYLKFYNDYCTFFKEGIITHGTDTEKEELSKLLRFESSLKHPGEMISLVDYCERLAQNQKHIYYLSAPSRALAEQSPYFESFRKRNLEVLFCYEPYDELVLMNLRRFKSFDVISVEKEMHDVSGPPETEKAAVFNEEEMKDLISYIKTALKSKAYDVKTTDRLESHPCVVTVHDMASARHFIRTQSHQFNEDMRYSLIQPRLEINPNHPLIKNLVKLKVSDKKVADLLIEQLFMNAMVNAGLLEDSRGLILSMNELLTLILEKRSNDKSEQTS
ncbi:hypothetical protein QAD02_009503 [Eretmocerus hayati]|uniref:Uncharacterized protein n=1 Tax=Eretmocerus hayati TaxID=131215 RepID=A0ACC2N9J2_9HYME|nr:hypothetical protein QAD02_009503 [Eretmocerus hayati]